MAEANRHSEVLYFWANRDLWSIDRSHLKLHACIQRR
jgi:hypothetical protein